MNKIFIIFVFLFLVGCGGSGTSSTGGSQQKTEQPQDETPVPYTGGGIVVKGNPSTTPPKGVDIRCPNSKTWTSEHERLDCNAPLKDE
jgi:hypothetical protein